MIDLTFLKELAGKNQTAVDNIFREYVQHLFLNYFYQEEKAKTVLFKGGIALRIVFNSPRYSEDLDFSGFGVRCRVVEDLWAEVFWELEKEGLEVDTVESKATSGGCLGIFKAGFEKLVTEVHLEISLRADKKVAGELVAVAGPYLPAFTIFVLPEKELILEKYHAFLTRSKPRDFFDLYFILRAGQALPEMKKEKILRVINRFDPGKFGEDVKRFLPKSMRLIVKDFEENLTREVERVFR